MCSSDLKDAQNQAESMISQDEITVKSRQRSADLMQATESNIRQLKMSTYDYVDGILFDFQQKMDELSATYFEDMFSKLETTFNEVNATLASNREEIKEMAYRTSMNLEEKEPGAMSPEEKVSFFLGYAEMLAQLKHTPDNVKNDAVIIKEIGRASCRERV